jgi:hypothetical protein
MGIPFSAKKKITTMAREVKGGKLENLIKNAPRDEITNRLRTREMEMRGPSPCPQLSPKRNPTKEKSFRAPLSSLPTTLRQLC